MSTFIRLGVYDPTMDHPFSLEVPNEDVYEEIFHLYPPQDRPSQQALQDRLSQQILNDLRAQQVDLLHEYEVTLIFGDMVAIGTMEGGQFHLEDIRGISDMPHFMVEPLQIVATLAAVIQVILMVVDLWSKGRERRRLARIPAVRKMPSAVKAIRVQMRDGHLVEFDSWRHDPNEVKKFVRIFQLPHKSPFRVEFLLNKGDPVVIYLSDNAQGMQQLDAFIDYLKQSMEAEDKSAKHFMGSP